jgi:hypothetical protein
MLMHMFRKAMDRLRGRFDFSKERGQEDRSKQVNIPTRPPKRKRRR